MTINSYGIEGLPLFSVCATNGIGQVILAFHTGREQLTNMCGCVCTQLCGEREGGREGGREIGVKRKEKLSGTK